MKKTILLTCLTIAAATAMALGHLSGMIDHVDWRARGKFTIAPT